MLYRQSQSHLFQHPVMFQDLRKLQPLPGIHHQELRHQVPERAAHPRGKRLEPRPLDLFEEVVRVRLVEGQASRRHHVQDDAHGPDVGPLAAVAVAAQDLGGHVIRRSAGLRETWRRERDGPRAGACKAVERGAYWCEAFLSRWPLRCFGEVMTAQNQ